MIFFSNRLGKKLETLIKIIIINILYKNVMHLLLNYIQVLPHVNETLMLFYDLIPLRKNHLIAMQLVM